MTPDESLDRAEQLLAECLELPPDRQEAAFEQLCRDHPELETSLRNAFESVRNIGLVGETRALRGAAEPEIHIEGFRILDRVGSGGMGVVYRAEQREPIQRTVAVKLIKRGMDTQRVLARFEAERQAVARMSHPAIAQVFDAGTAENGQPYFVMEYVDGVSILEYCDRNRLPIAERLELFGMVCDGVQHAHQKGIIHRDLKPSNVLVAEHDGTPMPKIIDFGIAKATEERPSGEIALTEQGNLIGTPEYISPEQAGGNTNDLDTRTDVYSLGVVLYELLTGSLPFESTKLRELAAHEIARVIQEELPQKPSTRLGTDAAASTELAARRRMASSGLIRRLRGDLDWVTMKALEKDRERRYASAAELARDVRRHLAAEPVLAGPPSRWYRLQRFVRRNRGAVAAAAAVVVSLVTGLGASLYLLVQLNEQGKHTESVLLQTRALWLTGESERAARSDQTLALLLAVEALQNQPRPETISRLNTALRECRETWQFRHPASVQMVKFAREGDRFFTATDSGRVFVWSGIDSRAPVAVATRKFPRLSDTPYCADIAPDGSAVAVASRDGNAYLWEIATDEVSPLDGHVGWCMSVQFSRDGEHVLTAGKRDRTAILRSRADKKRIRTLRGHRMAVRAARFLDGGRFVTWSRDKTVRLWSASAVELRRIRFPKSMFRVIVDEIHRRVYSRLDDGSVWWHDLAGDASHMERFTPQPNAKEIQLSPDCRHLLTWRFKTARLWSFDGSGFVRGPELHGHTANIQSARFSPKGDRIVTWSADSSMRVWDLRGNELFRLCGHRGSIRLQMMEFSRDGRWVLSGAADDLARLWDLGPVAPLQLRAHPIGAAIHVQPCGEDEVLVHAAGGVVHRWNYRIGAARRSIGVEIDSGYPTNPVVSPQGEAVLVRRGKRLALIDLATARQRSSSGQIGDKIACARFLPGTDRVIVARFDELQLWRVRDGSWERLKASLELPKGIGRVHRIDIARNGARLAISTTGRAAFVWELDDGGRSHRQVVPTLDHGDNVPSVCFDRAGERILTSCIDGVARLWTLRGADPPREVRFVGHESKIISASFSRDETMIVTSSDDGTARVWDVATQRAIRVFRVLRGSVPYAWMTPDQTRVLTASSDGRVRVWLLDPDELLDIAERRKIRELTELERSKYLPDAR